MPFFSGSKNKVLRLGILVRRTIIEECMSLIDTEHWLVLVECVAN